MKKILLILGVLLTALLLGGCSHNTYSQSDIGDEPETIDETTVLGTWYFKGQEAETIEFYDDYTYKTDHDGKIGHGTYSFSDDYKTIHIDDDDTEIDEDVQVMYGNNILYFIWNGGREQLFLRDYIEETDD